MKKVSLFFGPLYVFLTVSSAVHAQSSKLSLSQSCIQSVCGADNPMAHPFAKSSNYEKEVTNLVSKKLDKPLKNYMGRIISRNLLKDKLYKKVLESSKTNSLSAEQNGLLSSILFFNKLDDYMAAVDIVDQSYKYNAEKLKKINPSLSTEEITAITLFSPSLNSLIQLSRLTSKPFEVALKSLNEDVSLEEAQKKSALTILYADQLLFEKIPLIKKTYVQSLMIYDAYQGKTLSPSDKQLFLRKLMRAYGLLMLFNSETQANFAKATPDFEKAMTLLKTNYMNSSIVKSLENPSSIKETFQSAVKICTQKLAYAYAGFPTTTQLNDFKEVYTVIQSTAKQIVEERTKTSIGSAIDIVPLLPPAREDMLASISSQLVQLVEQNDVTIKDIKTIDLNDPEISKSGILLLAMAAKDTILSEALEYCDQQQSPALNDSAMTEMKMINLSWPTIQYLKLGVGVVSHEIGHVVSKHFGAAVSKEKQCLTDLQGTDKYAEEDFADLFSKEVERRLNFKYQKKPLMNLGCALADYGKDGWLDASLTNRDEMDPHSTGFYRMLAMSAGSIGDTKECRAYTESVKETRFNSYCKWATK